MKSYLDLGFYIGITGWIIDDRRAEDLRDAIKYLPIDKMLIETDALFLKPRNMNNKSRTNFPWYIDHVVSYIANYLKIDRLELTHKLKLNTERLFNLE